MGRLGRWFGLSLLLGALHLVGSGCLIHLILVDELAGWFGNVVAIAWFSAGWLLAESGVFRGIGGLIAVVLINSYVYGAVAAFFAQKLIPQPRHPETCSACGYDLRGTATDKACPECGMTREAEAG